MSKIPVGYSLNDCPPIKETVPLSIQQIVVLVFNTAERRLIIESLNNLRSRLIAAGRFTDAVDELLLKFVDAKVKKFKVIHTV